MKRIICFTLALINIFSISAQTIKKYSGQMSKPEWISELFEEEDPYDISGFYSYYEDERENRVIHGNFMISYKTSVVDFVDKYEINGSYSHGKRVGKWVLKAKLFNKKYAKNYLYQFSYRDGVLNGPFHFYSPKTEEVEITGQFVNGVISGKVVIKQHCWLGKCFTQAEGMVNDKGNPHGVWTEKKISEKVIPKDITRLYYDGNLIYRREKDLSSGNIIYTYSVSDEIRIPADTVKISDTIIKGKEYVKVGTLICAKDTNIDFYDIRDRLDDDRENKDGCLLYGIILKNCPMMGKVYPSIINWHTRLDRNSYAALIKREQEEKQRKEEAKIREEKAKEERRIREKAEEEERIRRKQQQAAELKAKGIREWKENRDFYLSIFDDSVNFNYYLENGSWKTHTDDVIDNELNGKVSDLSEGIIDRSTKGYKKCMDTLQVKLIFPARNKYILTRKQGKKKIAEDIISYVNQVDAERKAIRKEKNKKVWKTIGGITLCVAMAVGGFLYKYLSASSN